MTRIMLPQLPTIMLADIFGPWLAEPAILISAAALTLIGLLLLSRVRGRSS